MAKQGRPRKSSTQETARKLKPSDIRNLWHSISVSEWFRILNKIAPNNKWTCKGTTITGCCCYHDDSTPSMVLNFSKAIGRCFGCGHPVTDLIQLVAKLRGCSYIEALTYLTTEFELEKAIGDGFNELEEYNKLSEMKKQAAMGMHKLMDEYVREHSTKKYLAYMRPAMIYLTIARHIGLNVLGALPVGVFPKPEHIKPFIDQQYHDLYDSYFAKVNNPSCWGGVCFHYNDLPGSISRFKIRLMDKEAPKICDKYPDANEMPYDVARSLARKDFVMVEDQYQKDTGVFGLHFYSRQIGSGENSACLTEGEFDALSVMAAQQNTGKFDFIMLAAGGSGNSSLSFLRELGIRTVWIVEDAPIKNGSDVVKAILRNPRNFVGDSSNPALLYKIFMWAPEMQGGDLDEMVQLMGYDTVSKYLLDERNNRFLNSMSWVTDNCTEDIRVLKENARKEIMEIPEGTGSDVAEKNIRTTLDKRIVDAVASWLKCIQDRVDQTTFVAHFSETEGVDFAKLSVADKSIAEITSMDVALQVIGAALDDVVEFVFYESGGSSDKYSVWDRRQRVLSMLPMSDSSLEIALSKFVHGDIVAWVQGLLGKESPLLLEKATGYEMTDYKISHKNALELTKTVLRNKVGTVRGKTLLKTLGQGIHYSNVTTSETSGHVYILNGNALFIGTYGSDSGNAVEWKEVNSCVYKNLRFLSDHGRTWSDCTDVADLYAGTQVDKLELFNNIQKILDCWKFKDHEVMREYLAAWIMSLPIQRAIGLINISFISGESNSGKSSFSQGLLGGRNAPSNDVPYLLETSVFSTDCTVAWVSQAMNESSLLMVLDEAESRQQTIHSQRVAELVGMLKSVATGGASPGRGKAQNSGESSSTLDYFVEVPTLMSAIAVPGDPAFMSRVVPINTDRCVTHKNVGDAVRDLFSNEDMKRMRKALTTCLLADIPYLVARKAKLRAELQDIEEVDTPTAGRFITAMLAALLVYEMLGKDPKKLYLDMVRINASSLEAINNQDTHSDLINAVLYTEGIRTTLEENVTGNTSASKLILDGDYTTLNNSSVGVYYIPEKGWIVLLWRAIKYTLLRGNIKYNYMDDPSMKESIAKNKYLVPKISKEEHDYIVRTLQRSDIKNPSAYSVISAEYVLSKEQKDAEARLALENNAPIESNRVTGKNTKRIEGPMPEDIPLEAYDEGTVSAQPQQVQQTQQVVAPSEKFLQENEIEADFTI